MIKKSVTFFIEGSDGVGKSTISKLIQDASRAKNIQTSNTHIIRSTSLGRTFYDEFVAGKLSDFTGALHMLGSTVSTIEQLYENNNSEVVNVVDRSQASFYAYQMYDPSIGDVIEKAYEHSLTNMFYKNSKYFVIYIKCQPEIALDRINKTRGSLDSIETLGPVFQRSIQGRFEKCFLKYPILKPSLVIDTTDDSEESKAKISKQVIDFVFNNIGKQ